jgi:hypothetical protein
MKPGLTTILIDRAIADVVGVAPGGRVKVVDHDPESTHIALAIRVRNRIAERRLTGKVPTIDVVVDHTGVFVRRGARRGKRS